MIRPLKDNVLIKFIEGQEVSKTGIILTHKKEDKPQIAKVIAVGEEAKQVEENDSIIASRYIGNQVFIDNQEYIILKEREILAKVD